MQNETMEIIITNTTSFIKDCKKNIFMQGLMMPVKAGVFHYYCDLYFIENFDDFTRRNLGSYRHLYSIFIITRKMLQENINLPMNSTKILQLFR